MTIAIKSNNRGFSLVEVIVAMGVFAIISSMGAFLIFMVGRNAVNVHDQVLTQVSATNANERLTSVLRNASHFGMFTADVSSTDSLSRIKVAVPLSGGGVTTGVLYYDAQAEAIKMSIPATVAAAVTEGNYTAAPITHQWKHVKGFEMVYYTAYRLTLRTSFDYRGFILMFENPGNPQFGRFVTDVIAKNHYPGGESFATGPLSQ